MQKHGKNTATGAILLSVVSALALALSACGASGAGSSSESGKLSVATVVTPVFAHLYIAQSEGYFEDEGLDVTLTSSTAANVPNLVASGRTDLATLGTSNPLILSERGKPMTVLAQQNAGAQGGTVVAGPSIDSVEDLKGKRIAALPKGTAGYGWAAFYDEKYDLGADLVSMESPAAVVAAVESGQADAGVTTYAQFLPILEKGDFNVLVDTGNVDQRKDVIGEDSPEAVYFGLTDTMKERRDDVVKFLSAILRADEFIKSSSPTEVASSLRQLEDFKSFDQDQLARSIEPSLSQMLPNGGVFTEEQWDLALEQISNWGLDGYDQDTPEFSFDDRVDLSLLDEASGE